MKFLSIIIPLLFTTAVGDAYSASQKRTLKQLIDLGLERGFESPLPGKLAEDLGLSRSLMRRRIVISDGKNSPVDALSILYREEAGKTVPASLVWQVARVTNGSDYMMSSYHTTLEGKLISAAIGEMRHQGGQASADDHTLTVDNATKRATEKEIAKFLQANRDFLKGK